MKKLFIALVLVAGCGKQPPVPAPTPQPAPISVGVQIGTAAITGLVYSWSPVEGLDNPMIAMPMAKPSKSTLYTVKVSNACADASAKVMVRVFKKSASGELVEVL